MAKVEKLQREFSYNGLTLPDPGAQLSPEEVRNIYSAAYPEITSAGIEGPERKGDKLVYVFKRAVGTKGATLNFQFEDVDGLKFVKVEPAGSKGPWLVRFKKTLRPRLYKMGKIIDKYLFA